MVPCSFLLRLMIFAWLITDSYNSSFHKKWFSYHTLYYFSNHAFQLFFSSSDSMQTISLSLRLSFSWLRMSQSQSARFYCSVIREVIFLWYFLDDSSPSVVISIDAHNRWSSVLWTDAESIFLVVFLCSKGRSCKFFEEFFFLMQPAYFFILEDK